MDVHPVQDESIKSAPILLALAWPKTIGITFFHAWDSIHSINDAHVAHLNKSLRLAAYPVPHGLRTR